MSLIQCCECASKVSEYADKCPKCGCPVSVSLEKIAGAAKDAKIKQIEEENLAAEKAAEKKQRAQERYKKIQANKKKLLITLCIVVAAICAAIAGGIYYGFILPQKEALNNYSAAIVEYNMQVDEYNGLISLLYSPVEERAELMNTAEQLLKSDDVPFDENTKVELNTAFMTLKEKELVLPESLDPVEKLSLSPEDEKLSPKKLTTKTTELRSATAELCESSETVSLAYETLNAETYACMIEALSSAISAFETSVKIEQQLTNPSETFIMERLSKVDSVVEAQAVTEEHDPNGNLHKPGGYTSAVYFTHTYLSSSATGEAIIDSGTAGGGCIEVYASKEYAEQRDAYLGNFDGTIFDSGSHMVIGSIVIRTSHQLTATNQQALSQEIIEKFSALE